MLSTDKTDILAVSNRFRTAITVPAIFNYGRWEEFAWMTMRPCNTERD